MAALGDGDRLVGAADAGVGQRRVGRDLRRIVHVGDLDADTDLLRGRIPSVDRVDVEARVARFRAVAHEAQAGRCRVGPEQRGRQHLAHGDRCPGAVGHAVFQPAAGRQGVDHEAQEVGPSCIVVVGVVGRRAARQRRRCLVGRFAIRIVGVGNADVLARQPDRGAFCEHSAGRPGGRRCVVDGRRVEGEGGRPAVAAEGAVVVHRHAGRGAQVDGGHEVLDVAVVLEADVAVVQVLLGEGGVLAEGRPDPRAGLALQRATAVRAAATAVSEDGVDHLRGRHVRAGHRVAHRIAQARLARRVVARATQDQRAALGQEAARGAAVVAAIRGGRLDHLEGGRGEAAAAALRRRREVHGEGEGAQHVVARAAGRAVVVVDAAFAREERAVGVPARAEGVVDDLELEGVGVAGARARALHVLHPAGQDVGHGEGAAGRQDGAAQQDGALVHAGLGGDSEREVAVARIDVLRGDHRRSQRDHVRAPVAAERVAGRGHCRLRIGVAGVDRVVVHRVHVDRDAGVGRGTRRAGATAPVAYHHVETVHVGVRAGTGVVALAGIGIGQPAAVEVGDREAAGDVRGRDRVVRQRLRDAVDRRDAGVIERPVGGQLGQHHGQRAVGVVAAAAGADEVAHHRRIARGVGRLAFEDAACAFDGRKLVQRGDVERDRRLRRQGRGRGAIVDPHAETVGRVLVGTGGGVYVDHAVGVHVRLREDRAHAKANAIERQIAVFGQGREGIDELVGRLGSAKHLRIDRVERGARDDRGADLGHCLGGVVEGGRVIRRRHRHGKIVTRGEDFGVGHGHADRRSRRRQAQLGIAGAECELVQPGSRLGLRAGELETVRHADHAGRGCGAEGADGRIQHDGTHGDGPGAIVRDGPARERGSVSAGRVDRAWLRDGQLGGAGIHRGCREQPLEGRCHEDARLDGTGLPFQRPITAQCQRAGRVAGGRHVGTRQHAQALGQQVARGAHVAAVQEDVAVRAHRRADGLPGRGVGIEGCRVHDAVAQQHLAVPAMAQDVQTRDVRHALQGLGDLRDAGAARIDQDRRGAGRNPCGELLPVGDAPVDDVYLVSRAVRRPRTFRNGDASGIPGGGRVGARGAGRVRSRWMVLRGRCARVGCMGSLDERCAVEELAAFQGKLMVTRSKELGQLGMGGHRYKSMVPGAGRRFGNARFTFVRPGSGRRPVRGRMVKGGQRDHDRGVGGLVPERQRFVHRPPGCICLRAAAGEFPCGINWPVDFSAIAPPPRTIRPRRPDCYNILLRL